MPTAVRSEGKPPSVSGRPVKAYLALQHITSDHLPLLLSPAVSWHVHFEHFLQAFPQ